MKYSRLNRLLAVLGVATLPLVGLKAAPKEFNFVELDVLKNAPHRHWARGVVFKDVLTAKPGGRSIEIDDRRYLPFATRSLDCYIGVEDESKIKKLKKGEEYLFSGTIIHGKKKYLIAVSSIEKSIANAVDPKAIVEILPEPGASDDESAKQYLPPHLRAINELMETSLTSMFVYTKENQIEISELFNEESEHSKRGMDTIRATVRSMQKEGKTSSEDILSNLLKDMLIERYAPEIKAKTSMVEKGEEQPVDHKPLEMADEDLEKPVEMREIINAAPLSTHSKDTPRITGVSKKKTKKKVTKSNPKAKKQVKAAPEPIQPALDITAVLDYIGTQIEVVLDDATKN